MKIEQVFKKYLSDKYFQIDMTKMDAGPVITISRDTGCFAGRIAGKLTQKINLMNKATGNGDSWNFITKEILEKVSEELKISPESVNHILEAKKATIIEDLANSIFAHHYVSDSMIIATLKHIIKSFAYEGNVIIIGRAASMITHDIKRSLHVKLYAPKNFRERKLIDINHISQKEAKEIIKKTDSQRENFIKFFLGNKSEMEFYDTTINCSRFEEDKIVDMIYYDALKKGLI